MNVQLIVLGIAGFLAMNTYYDNKYVLLLKSWKKYYMMGGYLLGAFFIIWYQVQKMRNLVPNRNLPYLVLLPVLVAGTYKF